MRRETQKEGTLMSLGRAPALCAAALVLSACGEEEDASSSASFSVSSPVIPQGGMIPADNTCEGRPFPEALGNPQIDWTEGPEGTQSYALVLKHLAISDGPRDANYFRGFMWAIWDIPATVHSIPANLSREANPPEIPGAQQWTSYNQFGYFAPCPNFDLERLMTEGTVLVDDYGFSLYALSEAKLTLPQMAPGDTNFTMTLALHLDQTALDMVQLNAQSNAVPTMGPTPPDSRPALVYPAGIMPTPAPAATTAASTADAVPAPPVATAGTAETP